MGVIDKSVYTLRCSCGAAEEQAIVQYGSAYSAGQWEQPKPFNKFMVSFKQPNEFSPPEIVSAKCLSCGNPPEVSTK
jgi:hypothetical protein